jgi:hypothetical protein
VHAAHLAGSATRAAPRPPRRSGQALEVQPGDVDVRDRWSDYRSAYTDALRETDIDAAPWYLVPSDRKWYRNWAIAALLAETLEQLAPQYPPPDYDVVGERARVEASTVR